MRVNQLLAVAAAGLLVACAPVGSRGVARRWSSPPVPLPELRVVPGDLTTAHSGPVRVEVGSGGDAISDELLQRVASHVRLIDVEDGVAVPVDVVVVNPGPVLAHVDGTPTDPEAFDDALMRRMAYVELRPVSALGSGWYAVEVDASMGEVARIDTESVSDGRSRFRVSSAPVLKRIDFCEGTSKKVVAYAEFSEDVDIVALDVQGMLSVSGDDLDGPCSAAVQSGGRAVTRVLPHLCAGSPRRVRIGLRSTGRGLGVYRGTGSFEELVELQSLPEVEPGCRRWRR